MRFEFVLLADGVIQRPDGKIDLFGAGFDRIIATSVPLIQPRMAVVARVIAERDEMNEPRQFSILVTGPNGQPIANGSGQIQLTEKQREEFHMDRPVHIGVVAQFDNAGFPEYGEYAFDLTVEGCEARDPILLFVERPR